MGQCLSVANELLQQPSAEQGSAAPPPTTAAPADSSISPYYSSLPANAERHTVRNVYDGDTLTLTDERRVRFLGVDTPELKEKQPYAQEAKNYTYSHCPKQQDIWLSYERGHEKQDHYGRLLAWVWTKTSEGKYLCVNEGLVFEGFASAYTPSKDKHFHNWDKLVKLQENARSNRRGMWSNFSDETVYKTANGSAFHKRNCEHLANVHHLTDLKKSDAMKQGLHACRTCFD